MTCGDNTERAKPIALQGPQPPPFSIKPSSSSYDSSAGSYALSSISSTSSALLTEHSGYARTEENVVERHATGSSQDYSPSSIDSGYGTANSRPQFNLPLRTMDRTASSPRTSSANYIGPGYSSSLGYNQATYGQSLPSVQEVPGSPYTDSLYLKEAERTSYGGSTSYYPTHDQSSHETYAKSYPADSERKQDSGFSSYNSAAHGTTGASGSAVS